MLYAGNIGPAQDLKHLINLFSHKNFSDCLLVFVGEGREKGRPKEKCELK